MKKILLTRGKFTLIDDRDFEAANQFKWYAAKKGRRFYACRNIPVPGQNQRTQMLHQFLLPEHQQIDHKDGDGLNNSRDNLRPADSQQNRRAFRRKKFGASSRFRGVYWKSRNNKWSAAIGIGYRTVYLGIYSYETEAARAYDAAAKKYFGEFASLNFS